MSLTLHLINKIFLNQSLNLYINVEVFLYLKKYYRYVEIIRKNGKNGKNGKK